MASPRLANSSLLYRGWTEPMSPPVLLHLTDAAIGVSSFSVRLAGHACPASLRQRLVQCSPPTQEGHATEDTAVIPGTAPAGSAQAYATRRTTPPCRRRWGGASRQPQRSAARTRRTYLQVLTTRWPFAAEYALQAASPLAKCRRSRRLTRIVTYHPLSTQGI